MSVFYRYGSLLLLLLLIILKRMMKSRRENRYDLHQSYEMCLFEYIESVLEVDSIGRELHIVVENSINQIGILIELNLQSKHTPMVTIGD